uniref:Uncharacterized protein n=1 Tax=Romanomermis culicivorax TaxID=13658 RepID=A0A915ICA8_ROMCU
MSTFEDFCDVPPAHYPNIIDEQVSSDDSPKANIKHRIIDDHSFQHFRIIEMDLMIFSEAALAETPPAASIISKLTEPGWHSVPIEKN